MASAAAMDAGTRAPTASPPEPEAETPAPPAPAPTPTAEVKIPKAPGAIAGMDKKIGESFEEQGKAQAAVADVLAGRAVAESQLRGDQVKEMKTRLDTQQKQFADNQAMVNKWSQDVAQSKIDPNRFMASQGTGEKIGNAIAMILGGIGSGITGGQNPVLGIIQSKIQHDIDAQKTNLDSKRFMLSHFVQQGHDMQNSAQLANGAMQQIYAASLEAEAAKSGSPLAKANAAALAAQLKTNGLTAMQEAHGRSIAQTQSGLDVALKQYEMSLIPARAAVDVAARQGKVLPAAAQAHMDPKLTVQVGRDGVTYARTPEAQKEVLDTQQALLSARAAIARVRALKDTIGLGGSDSKEGRLAIVDLENAYQSILGRSNAPRGKQEEELSSALSNPTSLFTTAGGVDKQMNAMEDIIKKHAAAVYASRLVGGLTAAKGMVQ